jgi:short-subunit dehydrogenase
MEAEMAGNVLVVGGTRGLGYELAELFARQQSVIVASRISKAVIDDATDHRFVDLANLRTVSALVAKLPFIDTLVMAAGFAQFGTLDALSCGEVESMVNVSFLLPMILVQLLLKKQRTLPHYLQITSTLQWTPRANEPVYAASKAGIGMFAESMAGDPNIGRVLVVGPSGMKTEFWDGLDHDISQFLDPAAVAEAIHKDWSTISDYTFRQIAVLRNPLRVEVRKQS